MPLLLSTVFGPVTAIRRWFGNRSIRLKLNTIALVYVTLVLGFLVIVGVALNVNRGLRSYIQAEGLWSKGQKDAVYYLARYADSADEADFARYQQAIAIPLGDHQARLELQKPDFDYEAAERGFLAGGNSREDTPYMISLFLRFHDVGHMKRAIALWTEGDVQIGKLTQLAGEIHAEVASDRITPVRRAELMQRVDHLSGVIAPLAHDFSASLGEAAMWLRGLFLKTMIGFVALLIFGGLGIVMVSRRLLRDLSTLRLGTQRVANGDLAIQIQVASEDEVGVLTRDFNDMILHRRRAEARLNDTLSVLSATLESTTDGILVVDRAGRIVRFNQRFIELWQIPLSVIQTGDDNLALADAMTKLVDAVEFLSKVRELYADVEREGFDMLQLKDGRVFERFSRPQRIGGAVVGRVWSFRDVTERKRTEEALKESEQRARRILDTAHDAFVSMDSAGIITDWNAQAARLFGWSREEAVGRSLAETIIPPQHREAHSRGLKRFLVTGEGPVMNKTIEIGAQHRDGHQIMVELSIWAVSSRQGYSFNAFLHDITARKQGEAEILRHRNFESLITRLSTSMISLAPEQLDAGVNRALGELGGFAGVDRAYVFDFDDHHAQVSCTHEWCDESIVPQIARLRDLSITDFPWVEARLQRGEVVHVPRVSELPPEAAAERIEWEAESIQSLLLVPLSLGGSVVGYAGFDSVRAEKSWSAEAIGLLRIFGEMVVNVQQRKRAEQAIRAQAEVREQAQAHIQELAHHDALTRLPNRILLMDRMEMALERARRSQTQVAVMMLDLDHFKNINDSLGHAAGDQMLLAVAERLSGCARRTDTVARMGGDEFVIVLTDVQDRATVERVVRTIFDGVVAPITVGSHELAVTPSIGISIFPDDGPDPMNLLKNADTALYQAKAQGRGNHQWFTPTMLLAADERLDLENTLRKAQERDEFSLHYQPLVAVNNGQVVGMEALIRWQHPRRGLLLPGKFIRLAEETGLIVPIGAWVLRRACQEARRLQVRLQKPLIISVNISTRQFRQDNLLQVVKDALNESGLPPHTLVLEITESVLAANAQETAAVLNQIRALGVRIAVDDFGTGYSSLSYITRFPIDMLKIDASFVQNLTKDENDAAITSAIIALAHSLKLEVIAEGVETPEQLAFLQERSCNEVQGLYLGEPVSAGEFPALADRINVMATQGASNNALHHAA